MKWHLTHEVHGSEPWAVQAEGMRRSAGINKYFYALEQGLGKTSLTLNDFVDFVDKGTVDIAVVLAPQTFKADWVFAPEEWGVPEIPTMMWPKMKANELPFKAETALVSLNYEAASRSQLAAPLIELMEKRKSMLIIDESSVIKNHSSAITKSVLELAKRATVVRQLNGTPMTQSVMDWYPQLRAVGELNGVNPYQFRNRHAVMGGFMGKAVQIGQIRNEDELYRTIDRVTFRALKKDWRSSMPPQVDQMIQLEMTDAQRTHYQEMAEEFFTSVGQMEISAEIVLTQMAKLLQISSGLAMSDGQAEWIIPPEKNPKIRAALDLINGKKSIVVYHFKPTGQLLLDVFAKEGLNPTVIRGGMSPDQVREQKRIFNEDPSSRVLVAQQAAACMGHTLLGQPGDRCSRMVFVENNFNLRDRLQMRDRNHRGEQDETCNYYDLVCSPQEAIVVSALIEKRDAATVVDELITSIRKGDY